MVQFIVPTITDDKQDHAWSRCETYEKALSQFTDHIMFSEKCNGSRGAELLAYKTIVIILGALK
jgi:hypothetical protein